MATTYNRQELFQLIKNIRLTAGDMSLQKLSVLLLIADTGPEGTTLAELIRRSGVNQSNTSKMVHNLSKLTVKKTPGPGLVTIEAPPEDLSMRVVKLTEKGRQTMDMLFGAKDDA